MGVCWKILHAASVLNQPDRQRIYDMTRKSIELVIEEKGRDTGKLFKITEMSAFNTEAWAIRAINALLRNTNNDEVYGLLPLVYSYFKQLNEPKTLNTVLEEANQGQAAILNPTENMAIYFSHRFFQLPYDELKVLSDPLLDCCAIYLDPGKSDLTRPLLDNVNTFVEEPSTLSILRREAFKLHTDFFIKGVGQYLEKRYPVSTETPEK